jgi:protein SCO1/2
MHRIHAFLALVCLSFLVACGRTTSSPTRSAAEPSGLKSYAAKGIVKELKTDEKTVVIKHEEIPNYMMAMTMPFKVKDRGEIANLHPGDIITFRLLVSTNESWIDEVAKTGHQTLEKETPSPSPAQTNPPVATIDESSDFTFTNEFGLPVNLKHFNGEALALSFFFTRCPIPEFCPRLSQNFAEASRKLSAQTNGPTNWHFLSISIDSENDTPAVLKAYGQRYNYDSNHWNFLTGPADRIAKLTKMFGFQYERDGAFFKHEFRTVVIDTAGHVLRIYPFVGEMSDYLVTDMLKAAGVTNRN